MISIAMATYNGAKYIREQMNSILMQTIQDFELVICDDCSGDNTVTILQEYADNDSRIRLFKNDVNIGFKKNFEKVIRMTHGDYIALCDQDDIWFPDHLEVLFNSLGADVSLVCGNSSLINSNGQELGLSLSKTESYDRIEETDCTNIAYTLLFWRNPFQGAAMMMRRDFINYALPIPEIVSYHDVWLSSLACFCGGMKYVNEPVNKYRQHENNTSGGKIVRIKKFRTYLEHIRRPCLSYRLPMTEEIIRRSTNLCIEKRKLLTLAVKYHRRRQHLRGRLLNALFELIHYRLIYSCRGLAVF